MGLHVSCSVDIVLLTPPHSGGAVYADSNELVLILALRDGFQIIADLVVS